MTNHQVGHDAEKLVAAWLSDRGFKIVELNWRTRYCEIDIVAQHKTTLYFVEVKSRASQKWGSGLDYITPKKLAQMKFAAEAWLQQHDWSQDVRLAAIAVDAGDYSFTEIVG